MVCLKVCLKQTQRSRRWRNKSNRSAPCFDVGTVAGCFVGKGVGLIVGNVVGCMVVGIVRIKERVMVSCFVMLCCEGDVGLFVGAVDGRLVSGG